jgi:hypothetical protein
MARPLSLEQIKSLALIVGITLFSGIADAQGFIHASKIWHEGKLVWGELGKSASGFVLGIASYWLSLRYMRQLGVVTPELQTLTWFAVTLTGVALVSGKIFKWPLVDQMVALVVLLGVAFLLSRGGE